MSNIAALRIKNGQVAELLELVQGVSDYKTPGELKAIQRAEAAERHLALALKLVEKQYAELNRSIIARHACAHKRINLAAAARSYLNDACAETRAHLSFLLAKES